MHGCACGEGNGWFEGGADSYTCKHCFEESGKYFTTITAYYEKGIAPREETLLQGLILHHTKLTTAKRHKNNEGTAQLLMLMTLNLFGSMPSSGHTLRRQSFWKMTRQSFRKARLLRVRTTIEGRPSISASNKTNCIDAQKKRGLPASPSSPHF